MFREVIKEGFTLVNPLAEVFYLRLASRVIKGLTFT